MLDLSYQSLDYAIVKDFNSFYREPLPEVPKVKSLISTLRLMYSLPQNKIELYVGTTQRYYKIIMRDDKKIPFGVVYYLPELKRLDLYTAENLDYPLLQWRNRKVEMKNYNRLFMKSNIESVFTKLINIL